MKKKLVLGILAHVDAGKTTLSEGLLFLSGKIRSLGRVDNKDAYLDTYELERARGITIFSKQAIFAMGDIEVTLLDTPGHVDFSAEMERTLQVLDYGILVVNGAEGVQGHTHTLWRLLKEYNIPVFIFVNKMDQQRYDKDELMKEMRKQLDDGCVDFGETDPEHFYDQLAMCDEALLEVYLDKGKIETLLIQQAIHERKVFPCYFGSALKLEGVEEFMRGIVNYAVIPAYPQEFGAKVFKIGRDEQGNRLTYLKVTGGKFKVKDVLTDKNKSWEEKINQIRLYSGQKYEAVSEVEAGSICAVTGLTQTRAGEGLGIEKDSSSPVLEPVLSYQIILPEGCDPKVFLPKLRQIEEEEPELRVVWDEQFQEIQVQLMGEVQIEILKSQIKTRFGVDVAFDEGQIVYKETIANEVEGVGHFEPLGHYAEVHLLLTPGEPGSGLQFAAECSEEVLGKSWQRLILSHLAEKTHKGVLTGSPITDMKITLVSGRAHNKHTDGGDFREATYRAVRQGLKEAESVLLEPYYSFRLELPAQLLGRAMTDIERLHGTSEILHNDGERAVLGGIAPVATMRNYQKEVMAYTRGLGKLFCTLKGYGPCHNAEEVIAKIGYDSERDALNPTGSIFCANGTSFYVEWFAVKDYMHVESFLQSRSPHSEKPDRRTVLIEEDWISPEEVDEIIQKTYFANRGRKSPWKGLKRSDPKYKPATYVSFPQEKKAEYLLVDGYNIIHAWPELKELAEDNMDAARIKLLDALCNYQGIRNCEIMVVFDAYRVQGHSEEVLDYYNIRVVYTKEAQTADQYIERFAHKNQDKYRIVVATSDGLQQVIIRGAGCALLSARELKAEIDMANERVQKQYEEIQGNKRSYVADTLSSEVKEKMEEISKRER